MVEQANAVVGGFYNESKMAEADLASEREYWAATAEHDDDDDDDDGGGEVATPMPGAHAHAARTHPSPRAAPPRALPTVIPCRASTAPTPHIYRGV